MEFEQPYIEYLAYWSPSSMLLDKNLEIWIILNKSMESP